MKEKNLILAGLGLVTLTGIGIGKWLLKKKTEEKQEQEKIEVKQKQEKIEVKTKNKERLSVSKLLDKYNVPKFFGGHNCEDFYRKLTNSDIVYTLYVWEDEHGKEWLIPKKFRFYPECGYIEYQGIRMSLEEHDAGLLARYSLAHGTERAYFHPDGEETSEIFLGYGIYFDLMSREWMQYKTENTTKIYWINEEIHEIFENIWEKEEGILDIQKDKFLEDLESVLKKGN